LVAPLVLHVMSSAGDAHGAANSKFRESLPSAHPANLCQQRSRARNPCHQLNTANPCQPRTSEFLPAAQHREILPAVEMSSCQRQPELPGSGWSLLELAGSVRTLLDLDLDTARVQPPGCFLRGSQEFTRLKASGELGAGMLTGKRIKDQRARAGRRLPSESRQTTLYVACGAGTPSQLQSHLRRLCHGNAHSPAATVWGRRLWILHSRTVAFGGLLLTGRQRVRAT
jgi:hypothetical protein